jgi:putative ABC transport system permease protein
LPCALIRKNWPFAITVVVTLALAIGANTAVFSLLQAVLLKSLPYPNANRLVHMWAYWPGGFGNMSYPDYQEMLRQNHWFEEIAAYESWGNVALTGIDQPAQLRTEFVTPNFFVILGAKARIGRLFREDENRSEGGHPLAVLSYALWHRQYAADPGILSRAILLNGTPYTVIGVLSPEFRDPGEVEEDPRDIFLPTTMASALLGQGHYQVPLRFTGPPDS